MSSAAASPEVIERLALLLDHAVRALGDAGEDDSAARLAAEAWWLLREPSPGCARRLEATLHRLTLKTRRQEGARMSTGAETVLDVRREPPARRHDLIFATYGALGAGESFVLVNDHDPKPLWYQFDAEYSGAYSWDYLEQGPTVWRVRIGRPGG